METKHHSESWHSLPPAEQEKLVTMVEQEIALFEDTYKTLMKVEEVPDQAWQAFYADLKLTNADLFKLWVKVVSPNGYYFYKEIDNKDRDSLRELSDNSDFLNVKMEMRNKVNQSKK